MNGTHESTPDEAYLDRNLAVQVLARMAKELHYRVGIKDEDTEWPIIYIELPTGQVSWHIPAKELVGDFMETVLQWDGHDVGIKRQRLVDYIQEKHKQVTHQARKCDNCGRTYSPSNGNVIIGYCSEWCVKSVNERMWP